MAFIEALTPLVPIDCLTGEIDSSPLAGLCCLDLLIRMIVEVPTPPIYLVWRRLVNINSHTSREDS